ncbi:MAG: ferrous iron transport protein A [Balneolaceae bacterium]|nr:ferrous iron transport protein A [Balneolaceae bacterium]MBO6544783.1 ferrous iron transport protein A [Balneolaceae bacterium]MBO6646179.1 ferrous iron transport protein A [Balneolaceae bacterium]
MALFLSDISSPDTYRVKNIQGADTTRLLEMGITPGIDLKVVRKAPLGFPIEIKVRGYLLTLRESEAKCIEIEG